MIENMSFHSFLHAFIHPFILIRNTSWNYGPRALGAIWYFSSQYQKWKGDTWVWGFHVKTCKKQELRTFFWGFCLLKECSLFRWNKNVTVQNDQCCIWRKKGETFNLKSTILAVKQGGGSFMKCGYFAEKGSCVL